MPFYFLCCLAAVSVLIWGCFSASTAVSVFLPVPGTSPPSRLSCVFCVCLCAFVCVSSVLSGACLGLCVLCVSWVSCAFCAFLCALPLQSQRRALRRLLAASAFSRRFPENVVPKKGTRTRPKGIGPCSLLRGRRAFFPRLCDS